VNSVVFLSSGADSDPESLLSSGKSFRKLVILTKSFIPMVLDFPSEVFCDF